MEDLLQVGQVGQVGRLNGDELKSKFAEIAADIAASQAEMVVKILLNPDDFNTLCRIHHVLYASFALKINGIRVEKSDRVERGTWIEEFADGHKKLYDPKEDDAKDQ